MDTRRAEENLELIRTMMERSIRYEHLSARAGLKVGSLAVLASVVGPRICQGDPIRFLLLWGLVFLFGVIVMTIEQYREVTRARVDLWTKPARRIVTALLPALVTAALLTIHAATRGNVHDLPGIWMLCYGCGTLSTVAYAPPIVMPLGISFIGFGAASLWLGPAWAMPMMGIVFGGGHLLLGLRLLREQKQIPQPILRLCPPPSGDGGTRPRSTRAQEVST